MPLITAWAVFACGTFYMFQTLRVIQARRSAGVSLGDGGDATLFRRMRGQANAAEQMPLTLLALGMAELLGGYPALLIPLAVVFTGARFAHGIAFGWMDHSRALRFWGMFLGSLAALLIFGYLGVLVMLRTFG